jgi:hypothetical protein
MLTDQRVVREQHLQASLPLRITSDRAVLTIACSALLRRNTTMLFTVFGAAFGVQLYVAGLRWLVKGMGMLRLATGLSTLDPRRSGTRSTAVYVQMAGFERHALTRDTAPVEGHQAPIRREGRGRRVDVYRDNGTDMT